MIEPVRSRRAALALLRDATGAVLAWLLAYTLRFDFNIPSTSTAALLHVLTWAVPLQIGIFIFAGMYRGIGHFASAPELKRLLMAVVTAAVAVAAIVFIMGANSEAVVPRPVLIMQPLLLLLLMGGSRFFSRRSKGRESDGPEALCRVPTLILGADDAGLMLLKEIERSPEWHVLGLLDDDASLHGRELQGVRVIGDLASLPAVAETLGVTHVIVAMPSAESRDRRRAMKIAAQSGLHVLTVPQFSDLMSGKMGISEIRHAEIEDLLGGEPLQLDDQGLHDWLEDRVVLVSGAGGSVGSELCRTILQYRPSVLVCFDLSEFALYRLEQEFSASTQPAQTEIVYMVGDVRNERRVRTLMEGYRPAVVFHAAAYKHVPLMENGNVAEVLANNVLGTYMLARACKECQVEKFILLSTDKAVNPASVMGVSKRLAEMLCQGLQNRISDEIGTRFVIVRFGNVIGSSGSVIPKFREQIAKGGPVTIAHPEITRYFMSAPEACHVVMQAGLMGEGGEIFVPDMGEPVRIADIACHMIRLSGLQLKDIEIEYTGLRPGEKLHEALLSGGEHTLPTAHAKLRVAVARTADEAWMRALLKWVAATATMDEAIIKQELKMWVAEYTGNASAAGLEGSSFAANSATIH